MSEIVLNQIFEHRQALRLGFQKQLYAIMFEEHIHKYTILITCQMSPNVPTSNKLNGVNNCWARKRPAAPAPKLSFRFFFFAIFSKTRIQEIFEKHDILLSLIEEYLIYLHHP